MMDVPKFTDFLVASAIPETELNPEALDQTLNQLGAALVQDGTTFDRPLTYLKVDGCYVMRVFGDPSFLKFACEHQGYCKIVGERGGVENPEILQEISESVEYMYAKVAAKFAIRVNEIFTSEESLRACFESHFPQLPFDRTSHWKGILWKELDTCWREHGPDAKAGITPHDVVETLFELSDYLDFNLYSQIAANLQPWTLVSYRGRGDEQKQLEEIAKKWEKWAATPLSPAAKMVKNAFRPQDIEFNNDLSRVKALKKITETKLALISCRVSPKGSTPAFADNQNFSMVGVGGDDYVIPAPGYTVWYITWAQTPYILVNELSTNGFKTEGIPYVFHSKSGGQVLNEVLFSRGIATALWTGSHPGAFVFPRMQSVMFVTSWGEDEVRSLFETLKRDHGMLELHKDKRVQIAGSEDANLQTRP